MTSFKKDLENFEYDSRNLPSEHKWDHLADKDETEKFYESKRACEKSRFVRNRVQSNPETTGQYGTMLQKESGVFPDSSFFPINI